MNEKIGSKNYIVFLLLFLLFSFFVMKGFLFGILWGGVIAISVWPIFDKLVKYKVLKKEVNISKNSIYLTFLFGFFILLPLSYALYELSNVYVMGKDYVNNNTINGILAYPKFLNHLPMSDKIIDFWNNNISHAGNFFELINNLTSGKLFDYASAVWDEILSKLTTVLVMLITLYFMLKNGDWVKENYKKIIGYWLTEKSVGYIENGVVSLRATINGVILIGIIEGVLLSIPLVLGGVQSAFLIGLLAGIGGVIPLLMPVLIIPCLIFMYFQNNLLWVIIGGIDLIVVWIVFENIIKPKLISNAVKINTWLILASMIGGMQVFGFVGLFLGPAIISMSYTMIKDMAYIAVKNEK